MENANHLVLIAGLCRKLGLTPEEVASMLILEGEENRLFWNQVIETRNKLWKTTMTLKS